MKITAETIIVFDHGEYSDYSFTGPLRVIKDFDQVEVSELFREQWMPTNKFERYPSCSEFIAWMTKELYVESIDGVHNWFIGSYEFDPVIQ